jgi:hypothetical protein
MGNRKDGGPAFPSEKHDADGPYGAQPGMSLRDWFAGQVLVGLAKAWASGEVDDYQPVSVAHDAYQLADAMLAERDKQP